MTDPAESRQPREGGAHDESLIDSLFGWIIGRRRNHQGESVREAIEELIEGREETESPIDEQERRLLGNILKLNELTADDVMVPRADIIAVDTKASLEQLVEVIGSNSHSRYPVYRGTLDDAMGLVHIKDILILMASGKPFSLQRIVRKVLFVAPSMRVLDLLLEMRLKRTHMALVVDEYGGIDGLVTIEDVVEEIVGEIQDEHDQDSEPDYVERPDGVIEADARMLLEEFEAKVGSLLDEEDREDIDTLGGLVFFLAGRVPARGELIRHPRGIEFEVVDADPRRIKRLRIRNVPKPEGRAA
jgi:CBS domain containing-hemolysin-like protein